MQIRKFKGEEMSALLRSIHRELGPDAVILLTREIKAARGTSHRMIEVTAATEGLQHATKPEGVGEAKEAPQAFETQLKGVIQGDIYKELKAIKGKLKTLNDNARPEKDMALQKMHETWLEMKTLLKALTAARHEDPFFSSHQSLFELFQKLRADGIDSEMAKSLCKGVKTNLSPTDLLKPEKLHYSAKAILAASVEVTGGFETLVPSPECKAPKALALVGPTGVGKSTTLAKIAAVQNKNTRKVTLVSFDQGRRGDEERLRRYAERFHIPTLTLTSIDQLKDILSRRYPSELVLIDTVGCSHLDLKGLAHLKGLSDESMPIETHLVLSANTRASDMSDMIDSFSMLPIDSILFTKMDETRRYGALFSVLGRKRKPISFLTTGRRVPEDIEVATPERFSELVLKG